MSKSSRAVVPLSRIAEEVLDCIISDQWQRWSSDSGGRVGYRLGAAVGAPDDEVSLAFDRVIEPDSTVDDAVAEGFVRAQIASPHNAQRRLEKAAKRFRDEGGDPDAILDHVRRRDTGGLPGILPSNLETFADLLNAWIAVELASGDDPALIDRCRADVEAAQAKLFLRDFRGRYAKIIERCRQLEPLSMADDRLNEAHRTYLYGFYSASTVMAWVACEFRLRAITGQPDRVLDMKELLDSAQSVGALPLDGGLRRDAEEIIRLRNNVVHRGHQPTDHEATRILYLSRDLLEHLNEPGRWSR